MLIRSISRIAVPAIGSCVLIYANSRGFAAHCEGPNLKRVVGYRSVDDHVKSGMTVGLGTGSTAYFAVERLGQKLQKKELTNIRAVPTSENTRKHAESLKIPLYTLNEIPSLDIAIDGADQVDKDLNMVKGGGGALLREKMIELAAKKFIVIVDESKLVEQVGPKFPLPVEITPFCYEHTIRVITALPELAGCRPVLRRGNVSNNTIDGDTISITDNGNYIVDLHFNVPLKDVRAAAEALDRTVGVVEHGLFVGMADIVLIAGTNGVREIKR